MIRSVMTFLTCMISILALGQTWGVNTVTSLSYSGLSQSLRAEVHLNQWELDLGPKFNMSKHAYPWSYKPGVSVNLKYKIGEARQSSAFVLYEILPLTGSTVQEFYVGYGLDLKLKTHWFVHGCAGFGGYSEKAKGSYPFELNGLAYYTGIGVSYVFSKHKASEIEQAN